MSQAYLIADTKIHDPEKYEAYKRLAKPIVEESVSYTHLRAHET